MKKISFLAMLMILILSPMMVSAQQGISCDADGITAKVDTLYAVFQEQAATTDAESVLQAANDLQSALTDLTDNCAEIIANEGLINYDEIPQYRMEDGAFILGDPDSAIAIVLFSDYLCPHCQTYEATIDEFVLEYVATGQARLELRFVPTQMDSMFVFALAECAYETDNSRFWEAHAELYVMASNRVTPGEMGQELAEELDIPHATLFRCTEDMSEGENEQYRTDQRIGSSAGVTGTPTVRVRYGDDNAPLEALAQNSPSLEVLAGAVIMANSE
jgi:protein-disulfide isomerase